MIADFDKQGPDVNALLTSLNLFSHSINPCFIGWRYGRERCGEFRVHKSSQGILFLSYGREYIDNNLVRR